MNYEKKYKEALERAKKFIEANPLVQNLNTWIKETFPELKEPEDEKVRKALIEMVHDTTGDELWVDYNVHKEEALAWLEKQGEQKPQRMISAEAKEALYDKPAWSEEDEVKINRIVACLENLKVADNDILLKDVDWLKSLKARYTWKPSAEQIGVIESLINNRPCKRKHVYSLYNDLKKLMEDKT